MIRFVNLPDPSYGLPYATTDFSSVLQDEHIKAYGSVLDGINYGSTSSLEPLNSGIILNGCDILTSSVGQFFMGFTNSVVYIDGEFYQNDPTYTGSVTINNGTFYIVPDTATYSYRTLLDLTTSATASVTRYFKHQTSPPTEPYIKFSSQGTSRYYKRVLKYFTSRTGDVYISKSKEKFDVNGVGFNDMEGFVMLDDSHGITGAPDFRGNFLRGCESGLVVGGVGGSNSHSVVQSELGVHSHNTGEAKYKVNWATSGTPDNANMYHYHYFNTGRYTYYRNANGNSIDTPLSTQVDPDSPNLFDEDLADLTTGSIFTQQNYESFNGINSPQITGGVNDLDNSELQNHVHTIDTYDFGDGNPNNPGQPHENRPPYYVVVYYTKKPNT